jgi:hypothetical protein
VLIAWRNCFHIPRPTCRAAGKVGSGIPADLSRAASETLAIFNVAHACRPQVARSSTRRFVSFAPATVLYMAKKIGELYLSDVLHSTAAVHPAPVHSARVDRLAAIRVRFATKLVLTIHSSHIKIPEIAENAGRRVEMSR